MAGFSAKERLAASVLSAFPGLKKAIKWLYISLNAVVYKKNYTSYVNDKNVSKIKQIEMYNGGETFFGYYDKPCSNNGNILPHATTYEKKPIE